MEKQKSNAWRNILLSTVASAALPTLLLAADTTGVSATAPATQPMPPRAFSHPDRIRYDSQCFTIEGKDTFIFSGAFHYFRCPKELWSDRFDKIKAAGFNTVETYVAWNAHEPTMPASVEDYSKVDLKDLDDWLSMAEAKGLYVILRPGPYICAEWDCGGFPQWLITKRPADYKGMWLRSDEPTFVAWSRHWYKAVDQIAVKHQLSHRAPGTYGIILYQLENEYGGNQPDPVEVRYLRALGQQTIDDGIDVPLFTCWTGVVRSSRDPILRQVYDSCNMYPRFGVKEELDRNIDKLAKEQPDAPLQTTELQGGWFSKPGDAGSLSKSWTDVIDSLSPAQIQNLTLYAIAKGETVTNYYMLFGGTNFGDMAPSGITTSYDYSAPIREIGAVGEKYKRVAEMGAMLKQHGERLARSKPLKCTAETGYPDVTVSARYVSDQEYYLFIRTDQHAAARKGTAQKVVVDLPKGQASLGDVDYDLEPFGSRMIHCLTEKSDGKNESLREWLPKAVAEIKRPTDGLPSKIQLTQCLTQTDPGPTEWHALKEGQTLEQMGIYDRRFVFYRTHFDLKSQTVPMLSVDGPRRDSLLSFVNGTYDSSLKTPGGRKVSQLKVGENSIEMLYENVGQPNGGAGMEEMSGIRKIETLIGDGPIQSWRMAVIAPAENGKFRAERLAEVKPGFDDSTWKQIKIASDEDASQLTENQYAVFRSELTITADQLKAENLSLQVSRMDDSGWVFVNGKRVGDSHDWNTASSFPASGLHEGKNSIAIVIKNDGARGGLGMVTLLKADQSQPGFPIEIGTQSTGFAGQWWKTDLDETQWKTSAINSGLGDASHLQWVRLKFELPEKGKGIWVPWVARLSTSGNGFLYLNDHALGRYWQAGPQHDFFLPECWLNFGPGKKNVLTMCLRSADGKPVKMKSVEIVPVNEVAEFR